LHDTSASLAFFPSPPSRRYIQSQSCLSVSLLVPPLIICNPHYFCGFNHLEPALLFSRL
jgi:hypothetical protein